MMLLMIDGNKRKAEQWNEMRLRAVAICCEHN
jgi:hypothetical protein